MGDEPLDALERAVSEVDGERDEEELEVPGQRLGCLVVFGGAGGRGWCRSRGRLVGVPGPAGVDDPSAAGAGAIDSDGGGREEAVAGRAPGHGLIPSDIGPAWATGRGVGWGRLVGAEPDAELQGGRSEAERLADLSFEVAQIGGWERAGGEERDGGRVGGALGGEEDSGPALAY